MKGLAKQAAYGATRYAGRAVVTTTDRQVRYSQLTGSLTEFWYAPLILAAVVLGVGQFAPTYAFIPAMTAVGLGVFFNVFLARSWVRSPGMTDAPLGSRVRVALVQLTFLVVLAGIVALVVEPLGMMSMLGALLMVWLSVRLLMYRSAFGMLIATRGEDPVLTQFGRGWPLTAMQLGLSRDVTDPNRPRIVAKYDGDVLGLTLAPRPGMAIEPLTGLEENLRTLTGAGWADVEMVGNTVVYRLAENAPVDPIDAMQPWKPLGKVDLERVPFAVNRQGEMVTLGLNSSTILCGETGAGKGSVIWSLVGHVAGRDDVKVWGVDFKGGVEFATNPDVFESVVSDFDGFMDTLREFHGEMKRRLEWMRENRVRKVTYSKETPLLTLFIDEAAAVMMSAKRAEKAEMKEFEQLLAELFQQGRAPGVSVFVALQDPRIAAFPMRDLIPQRITLKLNNQNEQVLFAGGDSLDVAHVWEYPRKSGRGMFKVEGQGWTEFKTTYPDDDTIRKW